jgi:hypothetical protein
MSLPLPRVRLTTASSSSPMGSRATSQLPCSSEWESGTGGQAGQSTLAGKGQSGQPDGGGGGGGGVVTLGGGVAEGGGGPVGVGGGGVGVLPGTLGVEVGVLPGVLGVGVGVTSLDLKGVLVGVGRVPVAS